MFRRIFLTGLLFLSWLGMAFQRPAPASGVQACLDQASTLIQLVNNFRAGLGLPPYEVHPIVMAVAQNHSEYQASIEQLTHIGPGGSRPVDRLRAAGYGNGGRVLASENIAWGYRMGPQGAMDLWLPSPIHYYTITIPSVRHVGAGCASTESGKTYYTLLVAWAPGVGLPPPKGDPPPPTSDQPRPTPTPTLGYVPVIPATPRPDGAVVHTVQPGQTLMMIALSYRVPLEQILELNNLTRTSIIYPGQEIMISPPKTTPTPTATPKPTSTPTPADPTATPPTQARRQPTATPYARASSLRPTATVVAEPPATRAVPSLVFGLVLWLGLSGVGWLVFTRRGA